MNNEFNFQSNFEPAQKKPQDGYAIASLVLGIVSVLCCCCCCFADTLGLILMGVAAVLAIVFAFLSKKNTNGKMDGKAIAGLVLGIVAIVVLLCFLAALVGVYTMIGQIPQEELLAMVEETYKPMVDEATYNELVEAIKTIYATRNGQ